MTITVRAYQQRVLDDLYRWWVAHPGEAGICVMPTGAGKSVVIAELVRLLFDTWPDEHPRTVVLVPSKELAEQNAAKLVAMLPSHIRVGYYSASLGRKVPDADVIVATIGSIYRDAHLLGTVRCVAIDECHLVNTAGTEAGRFRQFLSILARLCAFRTVGFTATPFRGDGVWLTDGDAPLFTGIAATVTMQELFDSNHLAPLVRPMDVMATRIDTTGVRATGGDFKLDDLAERVEQYLPAAAAEAVQLAADRRKWIAFCPAVSNAQTLVTILHGHGIATALVCGDTPKAERAQAIDDFRAGRLRCLVTVLALAIGFDVPDVDCIIWLRPTQSPVLYVQGAGRGLRISDGKVDCLWLDFSDTTERLGPVDSIKGRKKRSSNVEDAEAPCIICDNCGARVRPASTVICPECGHQMREPEKKQERNASNAAVLTSQIAPRIVTYPVTRVSYAVHQKAGSHDSLRVDYWSGLRVVAREWVCFEHGGFAGEKARRWWHRRSGDQPVPLRVRDALKQTEMLVDPNTVVVNETGKWPEVVRCEFTQKQEAA